MNKLGFTSTDGKSIETDNPVAEIILVTGAVVIATMFACFTLFSSSKESKKDQDKISWIYYIKP